jgi:hypothetical protein
LRLKRLTRAGGLLLCIGLLAVTSRWAIGVPLQPPNEKTVVRGNGMDRRGMIVIGPPKSNYGVESMSGGRAASSGDRRVSDGNNAILPNKAEPTVSVGQAPRSGRRRALYGLPYPILMLGLLAFLFLLLGLCIRE